MPSLPHLQRRRRQFLDHLESPVLLMAGGQRPRNYPANPYPYRADSTFLFFFQDPEPNSAALFDPADGSVVLFVPERTPQDALWHGPVPGFHETKEQHGVHQVLDVDRLVEHVRTLAKNRRVHGLAVADPKATALLARITGEHFDHDDPAKQGQSSLIQALAELRMAKAEEELAEIRKAVAVTREAHLRAITRTRPGLHEHDLVGSVEGTFAQHACVPAYNTILSVRGEVLHNHRHDNLLKETDIVLLDAGAENGSGYCADVTRCWPSGGRFGAEGRDVYEIVLRANRAAIELVKPGMRYRDVHLRACMEIADGLVGMGVLRGNPSAIVESGAHALFFPHGVGHLLGLDVHDMECFGDSVAYAPGRTRSQQFGLSYLRLDLDLQPGMVVTIEPGVYFVPAILHNDEFRKQYRDHVDFERAERFLTMHGLRGFGGIRIEDDVACTKTGHEVLTRDIPKDRAIIEELVGVRL
ncbi:MAG: aminopeptidase P family protein [Planctomycetes bacterium]|nr:aminopeptidase P family protein [Planctomycetota bacterium]